MTFNHANAAFSVNARLATGCTATVNVSGVSLVNVKPTNMLTFTNGSAAASGSNITSALACSAKTLTTSNQAISSSPLIIPPQSVTAWTGNNAISSQTGVYLAVTCKVQANGSYVVGSASATGTVYVPMNKTLNKGEDNSVNLVFGSEGNNGRYYGRWADGTRIFVSNQRTISDVTSADLGKVLCTDGVSVYNTVAEATAAGKTAAAMISYVSGTGSGLAIALSNANSGSQCNWEVAGRQATSYTPIISGYSWRFPSKQQWTNMFNAFGSSANFRSKLVACGGTDVGGGNYWSSDGASGYYASASYYDFGSSSWKSQVEFANCYVRSCISF